MKGFIITLLSSTLILIGLMSATIMRSTTSTNVLGSSSTTQPFASALPLTNTEDSTSTQPSYLEAIKKGDIFFKENHFTLATNEYQKASMLEPNLAEPFFKLGKAYFADEHYQEALQSLTSATKNNPTDIEAQVLLGRTLLKLGQIETAFKYFEQINSTTPIVIYYRAIINVYQSNYEQARAYFESLTTTANQDAETTRKAQIYLNSMAEYASAQDPNPNYIRTLMARSFEETAEHDLAKSLLYDVLKEEPDYRDAWKLLGYAYLQEKSYTEAQEALFKAVTLDPTKAETRYLLGLSYFGLQDFKSAAQQFELALQSGFQPVTEIYPKLGEADIALGEYLKAAEVYEKLLLIDQSDLNWFVKPVWLYIEPLSNPKKALEWSQKALSYYPNAALSYNLVGWAQIDNEQWDEAEKNLNYAIILDPNLAAAYLNYAFVFEHKNDKEQAKEYFKRAYTLDPNGSIGNLGASNYNRLVQEDTEIFKENPPSNS
ncbi:MAG: SLEI family protein [Candidatus Peregrinibacteria bacterium GW2011_GWE2_39_6]|nr:MAG: SLEI family protein [Candidatus Peregrinibacteria bacterium GW2011_GWF2_39_17]KKR24712.1 MAG: SLEI family protein [Candidatus Peregrinibacteria bacterium GW2011_GWE2_39_6]HCW31996.1 hypothetical protein [Candidatus Peregrinibacteria bacterium]